MWVCSGSVGTDLRDESPHFNEAPGWFTCTLKYEKHWIVDVITVLLTSLSVAFLCLIETQCSVPVQPSGRWNNMCLHSRSVKNIPVSWVTSNPSQTGEGNKYSIAPSLSSEVWRLLLGSPVTLSQSSFLRTWLHVTCLTALLPFTSPTSLSGFPGNLF